MYDLSSFLDDHPGGDDVILTATGENIFDILHLIFEETFSSSRVPTRKYQNFMQEKMQQMILKTSATVMMLGI